MAALKLLTLVLLSSLALCAEEDKVVVARAVVEVNIIIAYYSYFSNLKCLHRKITALFLPVYFVISCPTRSFLGG